MTQMFDMNVAIFWTMLALIGLMALGYMSERIEQKFCLQAVAVLAAIGCINAISGGYREWAVGFGLAAFGMCYFLWTKRDKKRELRDYHQGRKQT